MLFDRSMFGRKPVGLGDELASPARYLLPVRMTLVEFVIVLMIIGVLICLFLPSGDFDFSHRYPPPGPITLPGKHAIAGEYYQGNGRGSNRSLSILPDGRYSFYWSGCVGVYHRESGYINQVDGNLVMAPIKPIDRRIDRVFVPIRWGPRSYLIATAQLQAFCDAIIRGGEPRDELRGFFYIQGDPVPVRGVPDLPEPWADYLRARLAIGTIVEVREDGRAKVDLGSDDGLHVGSGMRVRGREFYEDRCLKVVAVDVHSCEVEEVAPGESNKSLELGLEVAWVRGEPTIPNP